MCLSTHCPLSNSSTFKGTDNLTEIASFKDKTQSKFIS